MKKFFKLLCTVVVTAAIAVCGIGTVVAYAADNDVTITIKNKEDLKAIKKWFKGETYDGQGEPTAADGGDTPLDPGGYWVTSCAADPKEVTIRLVQDSGDDGWANISQQEQKKATSDMLKTISQWGLSQESQKKITQKLVASSDVPFDNAAAVASLFNQGADIAGAMGWFAPFSGAVGLILGIGVVLIMVLLLFNTIMDLVYIGIPMAQIAMQGKADKEDKDHPFGVSIDAVNLVKEQGESGKGGGGNIYLQYFKKRIVTYIILAVCVLYLLSGSIGGLIGGLLDMVSGITG